ncbi:alpha/beta hydrolase [Micromonospora sp. DT81.3]|uniref:alpha/beta hydrolase n=1 Tax=Micromonospora sp. DT81.3 TaxID=3416523 RepID=UPI003CE994F9
MPIKNSSPAPRLRSSRLLGIVALGTAVVFASSSCTAETDDPVPQESLSTTGIDWTSCGTGLECASVPVPLDWSDPDGEQITLAVIRYPASKPDEKIGTMFLNPGGPGQTGVGFVRDAGDDLDLMGSGRFDLIGWDARGTHASSPMHCFDSDADEAAFWEGVTIPSSDAEAEAYVDRMRDLAQRCGEVMGPLLSNISTADTARDMDHIRELLGEDKITYMGLSYGTLIGQFYANMFPEHVRAMLLDGVVGPVDYVKAAEARALQGSASSDGVFNEFLRLCDEAGPDRCALAGHGESAADRVDALFDRARQGPIPVPGSDPPTEVVYSDLQISSFSPLRDPTLWTKYAEDLEAAVEGDPSAIAEGAGEWRGPKSWAEATKSSAISCLDGPAERPIENWPEVLDELNANSRMSGAIQGWWLWAPCAADWPASTEDRYSGPWDAETEVPILLIGTRHDPNTGYQNAVSSEKLLGNAVLLTHDGYGHLSFNDASACIEEARTAYLVDLEVPEPGTVCEADKKPFFYD